MSNIMKELQGVVSDVLHALHHADEMGSCIAAASLLVRSLHLLGHENVRPLTVCVEVRNPALMNWIKEHGEPNDEASAVASNEAGAAIVVIGHRELSVSDDKWWAGHVVVIVPNAYGEKHAMLDLTIARPEQVEEGIHLGPIVAPVSDAFVTGEKLYRFMANGSELQYESFPDDHSYDDSGAWELTEDVQIAVQSIAERAKARRSS